LDGFQVAWRRGRSAQRPIGRSDDEFMVELRTIADWQSRLGDPVRHWKREASAMELAVQWLLAVRTASGLPSDIRELLEFTPAFRGARLKLAIAERRTSLPGGGASSQSDLWALLERDAGLASLIVEGKAREPFDQTVRQWLRPPPGASDQSPGKLERLGFICNMLGLRVEQVSDIRYQLLHRAAAALIEAETWQADDAVMVVQRFARDPASRPKSFEDFAAFLRLWGKQAEPGQLSALGVPGRRPLMIGWADSRFATDTEIAAVFAEPSSMSPAPRARNAFESLCRLASRESWCWNLTCTTCGATHLRLGLRELSLGHVPGTENWHTTSRRQPRGIEAAIGGPVGYRGEWSVESQGKLARLAAAASLKWIRDRCEHPDWLGYLGMVLANTRDAEALSPVLSRSWGRQLRELYPRAFTHGADDEVWRLSLQDLERCEWEATRPRDVP